MGKREALLVLLIIAVLGKAIGFYKEEEEEWEGDRREEEEYRREERFLLEDSKHVIQTEAGEMRVVRGPASRILNRPIHIGFITMEPRSLFIPQYMDSSLILYVQKGTHPSFSTFFLPFLFFASLERQFAIINHP